MTLPRAVFLGNATNSVSKLLKKHLDDMLGEKSQVLNAGEWAGEQANNKTLEPCPEDSPNLVGPFSVEFSSKRNWNEVRRKISAPLQDGGRHKPPDCVSKDKVREWLS